MSSADLPHGKEEGKPAPSHTSPLHFAGVAGNENQLLTDEQVQPPFADEEGEEIQMVTTARGGEHLQTERGLLSGGGNDEVVAQNQMRPLALEKSRSSDYDIGPELIRLDTKAGEVNHRGFPEQGLPHMNLSQGKDLLQSTITPFDYYNPIQVVKHPKNENEFITVQYVVQCIKAKHNYYTDEELPLYVRDGETELEFHASGEGAEEDLTEANCGFCKQVIEPKEGKWHNPKNPQSAQYCPKCYTQYYIRRRLDQKTKMHAYFQDFDMPRREETQPKGDFSKPKEILPVVDDDHDSGATEFVVLGFWKNHNCYAQFKVADPFIFVKKLEKQFLLSSSVGELYFFQIKDGKQLTMNMVNLDKTNTVQTKEVAPLPIYGKEKVIPNESGSWGGLIHAQLLGEDGKMTRFSQQQQQSLKIVVYQSLPLLVVPRFQSQKLLQKKQIDKQSLLVFDCQNNQGFQIPKASIFIEYDKNDQTFLYVNDEVEIAAEHVADFTYTSAPEPEQPDLQREGRSLLDRQKTFAGKLVTAYTQESQLQPSQSTVAKSKVKKDLMNRKNQILQSQKLEVYSHVSSQTQGQRYTIVGDNKTVTFERGQTGDYTIIMRQNWSENICGMKTDPAHFYLLVGLVVSQQEIESNMIPYDVRIMTFDGDKRPERTDQVTLELPNDILDDVEPNNILHYLVPFSLAKSPETVKFQLKSFIFIQNDPKYALMRLVYAQSRLVTAALLEAMQQQDQYDSGIKQDASEHMLDFEEQSFSYVMLRQEHYTEYPIQISTTYHPKRNKILIANLMLNNTRIMLDLGEYRFVSFVTGNISQYNQSTDMHQGVIPVYILVRPVSDDIESSKDDEFDRIMMMRYEVATIPSVPERIASQELVIDNGVVSFNENTIDIKSEAFQNLFNPYLIHKCYGWRPAKVDQTDFYLVVQTMEKILAINLYREAVEDKEKYFCLTKKDDIIAPVSIIGFQHFVYFVQKESNSSFSLIGCELNIKAPPNGNPLFHQTVSLLATRLKDFNPKTNDHNLEILDSHKNLHMLSIIADPSGPTLNRRLCEQISIDQNLIQIPKDMNWDEIVIESRSYKFIHANRLQIKTYEAYQLLEYTPLGYYRDQAQGDSKGPKPYFNSVRTLNNVNKEQIEVTIGERCYLHTKHLYDKRMITLISPKLKNRVKNYFIWGAYIVVQFQNDVLVYFDQETHMIARVSKIAVTKLVDEADETEDPSSIGKLFIVKEEGIFKDQIRLYKHEGADFKWTTMIHDFGLLKKKLKKYYEKAFTLQETSQVQEQVVPQSPLPTDPDSKDRHYELHCFTRHPVINQDGVPVLVWLVRNLKKNQENLQKSNSGGGDSDEDEPQIQTKVILEQITDTEYETLFSNTGMVEEESEAEIDPEKIKCLNYFVYDFPQTLFYKKKVSTKFEMQAICTDNYLIYTTPQKVNFISLKQVARAKAMDINTRRAKKNKRNRCCQSGRVREVTSKIKANFADPISKCCRPCRKNKEDRDGDAGGESSSDDDCDIDEIVVKSIDLAKYYVPEILNDEIFVYELRELDRKFVVRDYNKERKDSIQIRIGKHISIIWDLKENEEITNLIGWSHLNQPECIVRSGHRLTDQEGHDLSSSKDKQLYAGKDWCARLYAEIDLDLMSNIKYECDHQKQVKQIDELMLLANVRGHTFFTSQIATPEQMQIIVSQLRLKEFPPVFEQWNLLAPQMDHNFLRQLYQILLTPAEFTKPGDKKSRDDNIIKHYMKIEDKLRFKLTLQLLLMSSEIRISNLVNSFSDFDKLLQFSNEYVYQFLSRSLIETKQTKSLATLQSTEGHQSFIFGQNSPMVLNQIMKDKFERNVKTSDTEQISYNISVLEAEWLEGSIPECFQRLNESPEEIYDNKLVIILMDQLNMSAEIKYSLFLPFLVYGLCIILYYLLCLNEGYYGHPQGYFKGERSNVALRCIILIFTVYFLLIELLQFMLVGPKSYIRRFYNLNNLFMMVFNIVIIIMHSRQDVSLKVLSTMAAISSIHLGLNIFMWMRIFENTAIYVKLITDTIMDLRQFLLIFFVCVGAFGVCIAVINRYQIYEDLRNDNVQEEYLYVKAFGYELADAVVNQYLVSLGDFSLDPYADNELSALVWVCFVFATFFVQVVFLNMLIAIMATTYTRVTDQTARNVLRMRTALFADYIHWLNLIGTKQNKLVKKRYIYTATLPDEADGESLEAKLGASIESVNQRLALNFKRQQNDLRELQDSQKLIKEEQLKHHEELKDLLERLQEKVNAMGAPAAPGPNSSHIV